MRPDNVRVDSDALGNLSTSPDECAEGLGHKPGAPCSSKRVLDLITDFVVDAENGGSGRLPQTPEISLMFGARGVRKRAHITREQALAQALETLPAADTVEGVAVREAAAILGCTSESCVLAHPAVHGYAEQKHLAPDMLNLELERRFKAAGPRDSLALLSNYNIDETLQRWARVYTDFFPCPFAMMDFDRNGDLFGSVDLVDVLEGRVPVNLGTDQVKRKSSCFGCVLNTDTSSGHGKHWVAVFVDCRAVDGRWSVEYFNSAGKPPPRAAGAWMARTRARLSGYRNETGHSVEPGRPVEPGLSVEIVPVTDVGHQESQTECGLYSLFYIRCRLEGIPYTYFYRNLIPDSAMTAFRQHVFRANK